MHDIFISFSSQDEKKAQEICNRIERQGMKCWFSARKKDCAATGNYTQEIPEAIDSSKIFLLVLSNASLSTEQVLQEVTIANERQRYGLKLFAVNVAENGIVDMELYRRKLRYTYAGKQPYRWGDLEDEETLFQDLWDCMNAGKSKDLAEIASFLPKSEPLIGRDQELRLIADHLSTCHKLWISGLGGIGKSALLSSFCNQAAQKSHSQVVYLSVDKCIAQTLDDDHHLQLMNDSIADKRRCLTNYEYALYKLSVLENSVDPSMLIAIDNVEDLNDPLLKRLCQLNCDVIIASRKSHSVPAGFAQLEVQELEQSEDLHSLFELYYGERISPYEYSSLDALLESIHFHTMTIVLIAKQLKYFKKKPSDYRDKNQITAERVQYLPQIMSGAASDAAINEMYLQLFDLFDVTTLSKQEKAVMKTLCLLPAEGMPQSFYLRLAGNDFGSAVAKLEKKGWIQYDEKSTLLFLHPLVRDIAIHELGLYLDDPDVSKFISGVVKAIEKCWDKTYEENSRYKNTVLSIYFLFPEPTLSKYSDYLTISKFLWILNYMDISLEIQYKVKNMFISENGQHASTSSEAETMLQIGFTQHGKGDYQGAEEALGSSARLFGNRYAAALSHLAQAKMEKGTESLDAIEPLLKESLQIRERFWKNSLSEAASCHLYAKVLSAFQQKLDYAITLEKRAYHIYKTLQPNTSNVSSAAYILGWLYVLTADDAEDVSFGIEKLEEAKEIRIRSRDRLHPWMEDIYLKLGMAYEKIEDHRRAADYYQLLLDVRERKYSAELNSNYIRDTYLLLCGVYEKLGDEDGMKRCRKKLRYML